MRITTDSLGEIEIGSGVLADLVEHIVQSWPYRERLEVHATITPEILRDRPEITNHMMDALYAELGQKARGRIVLTTKTTWHYTYNPYPVRLQDIEGDNLSAQQVARIVPRHSLVVVRLTTQLIPNLAEQASVSAYHQLESIIADFWTAEPVLPSLDAVRTPPHSPYPLDGLLSRIDELADGS